MKVQVTLQKPSTIPDLSEFRQYLSCFEVDEAWRAERDKYLDSHLIRFRETIAFLPPAPFLGARLLELGASPFLFTLLLERYANYDVDVAGEEFPDRGAQSAIVQRNMKTGQQHVFAVKNFNVELDTYPYEDDTYDAVICCELLEHLVLDPTHMFVEIHRILKPGGSLLITTPNVLVLRHVNALLRKRQNIFDPYSGYGIYGRHNREFTIDEVTQLLCGCGFRVERAEIRDTFPHQGYSKWLKRAFPHLRDVIFVMARAEGIAKPYYPDNLYTAQHARHLRHDRL